MHYDKVITATVYVVKDNKVLLHKHKKYNTWFPVGGHVEPSELPYEAAIREAQEESGLAIRLITTEIAPTIDIGSVERIPAPFCLYGERSNDGESFFDFIYIATADSEEISPGVSESKIFTWFSKEDLLNTDVKPHVKNTALAVLEYLSKKA